MYACVRCVCILHMERNSSIIYIIYIVGSNIVCVCVVCESVNERGTSRNISPGRYIYTYLVPGSYILHKVHTYITLL